MARDQGAYAAAAQSGKNANSVFGMDMPAISQQLNPNAQTRSAMTQLPMQAANAGFDAARQSAAQRVAKTNNSAGYTGLADKLAMDKGVADSTAALQGQNAITNLQNEGVKNAGNIFGISQDAMAPLYNAGSSAVGASYDWTKGLDSITNAASKFLGVGKPQG